MLLCRGVYSGADNYLILNHTFGPTDAEIRFGRADFS